MVYNRARYDLDNAEGPSRFAQELELRNIGVSIHVFGRGEGFDFFHNHREQEEVYFCLQGSADLKIGGDTPETVHLERGDIVRVDAKTLRAIGNESSDKAVVFIAGGCPHTYPDNIGHHDVIADVLSIVGQGSTGFTMPKSLVGKPENLEDTDC